MATNDPRITARVDQETQQLLARATAITGMASINSFVLSSSIEKAKQVIEQEELLKLSRRDAMMLVEALDAPPKSLPRLKEAAKRYKEKFKK
ncbi:DUF1778 domain-containing protein [Zooshikella sp. RANM57]|uniref:type II toxin-antitoxin system TacA family antitoxin n=1 Tax=Zooshikella sp. RANM57 TaxID=3425863 RepID=UPI003D6E0EFB